MSGGNNQSTLPQSTNSGSGTFSPWAQTRQDSFAVTDPYPSPIYNQNGVQAPTGESLETQTDWLTRNHPGWQSYLLGDDASQNGGLYTPSYNFTAPFDNIFRSRGRSQADFTDTVTYGNRGPQPGTYTPQTSGAWNSSNYTNPFAGSQMGGSGWGGSNYPSNFTNTLPNYQIQNPWGVTPYGFINQTPQVPYGGQQNYQDLFRDYQRQQSRQEWDAQRAQQKLDAIPGKAQTYYEQQQNRPYQDYESSIYDVTNNWGDWSHQGRLNLMTTLEGLKNNYMNKNNVTDLSVYTPGRHDLQSGTFTKDEILAKVRPESTGWSVDDWTKQLQAREARGNPLQGFGSRSSPNAASSGMISYNADPYAMNMNSMYSVPQAIGIGPWSYSQSNQTNPYWNYVWGQ